MKSIKLFLLLAFLGATVHSCTPDEEFGTANLSFSGEFNNMELLRNQVYTNSEGQFVQFSGFDLYFSKISLINDGDVSQEISDVTLQDLLSPETISTTVNAGNYKAIQFNVGLTPEQNIIDPTTFDATHPQSTANNMFWSWGSQYRFMKIDGRADFTNGEILDSTFSYHTGFDDLMRTITIETDIDVKADETVDIELEIDLDVLFGEINMIEEDATHALTPLATKLHDNMTNAVSVK